jgi:hypothetical protein
LNISSLLLVSENLIFLLCAGSSENENLLVDCRRDRTLSGGNIILDISYVFSRWPVFGL